jgi:hypothetical protein
MKFPIVKITIVIVLFFNSCAERDLFTDPGIDPSLGGVYTKLEGNYSGTLTKSKSPYLVRGNLVINENDTLIIEPGAQLFFEEDALLTINGVLIAAGTKSSVIIFTSFQDELGWKGIHIINPTGSSKLNFCIIKNVFLPQDDQLDYGALEISNGDIEIENCIFVDNYTQYGGGLAIESSTGVIKNNIFYNNEAVVYGGAILSLNSTNQIINNTIYSNTCFNFGGAIVLFEPVNEELQNNIFYDNYSYQPDPPIALISGDTSNIFEQYNFFESGNNSPEFVSEEDLHLKTNSPCIDAGNPDPAFNDVDGSQNDQGAYGGPDGDW